MDNLIFNLGVEKVCKTKSSYEHIPVCECVVEGERLSERGTGPIICRLARQVSRKFGLDYTVTVKRGEQVVFDQLPLQRWAETTVVEGNNSARFVSFSEWDGGGG